MARQQQSTRPALTKKEERERKKILEQRNKEIEKQRKLQRKELEKRRHAALKQQRARAGVRSGSRGPFGILSFKGIVFLGVLGYLWVAQRGLLMGLVRILVRTVWSLTVKPLVRLVFRGRLGNSRVGAGGELPGGY